MITQFICKYVYQHSKFTDEIFKHVKYYKLLSIFCDDCKVVWNKYVCSAFIVSFLREIGISARQIICVDLDPSILSWVEVFLPSQLHPEGEWNIVETEPINSNNYNFFPYPYSSIQSNDPAVQQNTEYVDQAYSFPIIASYYIKSSQFKIYIEQINGSLSLLTNFIITPLVTGPNTSVSGDLVAFGNNTGNSLIDTGINYNNIPIVNPFFFFY